MRWGFFLGACILAWYVLLSWGAPPEAATMGTVLAAVFTLVKRRAAAR